MKIESPASLPDIAPTMLTIFSIDPTSVPAVAGHFESCLKQVRCRRNRRNESLPSNRAVTAHRFDCRPLQVTTTSTKGLATDEDVANPRFGWLISSFVSRFSARGGWHFPPTV